MANTLRFIKTYQDEHTIEWRAEHSIRFPIRAAFSSRRLQKILDSAADQVVDEIWKLFEAAVDTPIASSSEEVKYSAYGIITPVFTVAREPEPSSTTSSNASRFHRLLSTDLIEIPLPEQMELVDEDDQD